MKSNVELDELKDRFYSEIESYYPDWEVIARTNQNPDKFSYEEAYQNKVKAFCNAMKKIRESKHLKAEEFGERLGYTRQYIYKIENEDIKTIPLHKFNLIKEVFGVSPAFLLGLIEKEEIMPSKTKCYFWEHPKSVYKDIEKSLIEEEKDLITPMEIWGPSLDELFETVSDKIKDNYELLYALSKIYKMNNQKRKFIIDTIVNYSKLP